MTSARWPMIVYRTGRNWENQRGSSSTIWKMNRRRLECFLMLSRSSAARTAGRMVRSGGKAARVAAASTDWGSGRASVFSHGIFSSRTFLDPRTWASAEKKSARFILTGLMIRGMNSYSRESRLAILSNHLAALVHGICVHGDGTRTGQHGKRRLGMGSGEKPRVEGIELRRDISVDDVIDLPVG